jgi:hypothetical protein
MPTIDLHVVSEPQGRLQTRDLRSRLRWRGVSGPAIPAALVLATVGVQLVTLIGIAVARCSTTSGGLPHRPDTTEAAP